MKKVKRRHGFTIVELVIVIAIIAILASVLVPTFINLYEKAKESAALQTATNAVKAYIAGSSKGELEPAYIKVTSNGNTYWFEYDENELTFLGIEGDEFLESAEVTDVSGIENTTSETSENIYEDIKNGVNIYIKSTSSSEPDESE